MLVKAHEEVVLGEAEEVLAEAVVGVQCCVGEGRAVQIVLRSHFIQILVIRILASLFTCVDGCKELPFCCHEFVL